MPKQYKCSCHPQSAFHWASPDYQPSIKWRDVNRNAQISESSTRSVNDARARGIDLATIHSLSRATHTHWIDPKRFHVYSKAGSS